MRQAIKVLTFIAMVLTFTINTYAQDNSQRKSKEELAQLHAKHIAGDLGLDEATTKRFVETFCSLQKQIWEAEGRPTRVTDQMNDEEAEKAILARFDHSQKILEIRKKGYYEYRKFLTPLQIDKVYRLEKQDMQRTAKGKTKSPGKGGAKGSKGAKGPKGPKHRK